MKQMKKTYKETEYILRSKTGVFVIINSSSDIRHWHAGFRRTKESRNKSTLSNSTDSFRGYTLENCADLSLGNGKNRTNG